MLSYDQPFVNAVAFAGGSSYGLAVATGAADEIKATTQNPTQWENIATVVGAIIFDVGGRRFSQVTPDYESLYLPRGKAVGLLPVAQGEFLIQGERPGRLRFTRSQEGGVTGLILNPGPWGIPATRLP